jgi:predicted 3-demethylubiquinone-9 3-methyltransferase (glyoxalase superfamily)
MPVIQRITPCLWCDDQAEEVVAFYIAIFKNSKIVTVSRYGDHYWNKLSEGGDPNAQQCGWLKDRYGVSWQIVPRVLVEMIMDPDAGKSQRVMTAMLQMKKIDIKELRRAYAG